MDRILIRTLKVIGVVILLLAVVLFVLKKVTKSHSPEDTVVYEENGLKLEVFYNRPYKKGREIFGGLVPYDTVWRTGANEATTFSTNKNILVDGSLLKSGEYTLWTIPEKDSWKVIFNSHMYPWGINIDEEAYRDPQYDALILEVPTRQLTNALEQFTIYFEKKNDLIFMVLEWDKTMIEVPIKREEAPVDASS